MTQTSKKDFSDWLIVSDVDGTLNTKLRTLPKRNLDAITRFVRELNGNFTLASGRNIASLKKHFERLPIQSPAVILNGAGIYDYNDKKMLSFHAIDENGRDIARKVSEKFPLVEMEICTDSAIYLFRPHIFVPAMTLADKLPHTDFDCFDKIPAENWGKVIFLGMPHIIKKVKEYLSSIENPGVTFMSSSIASYEMLTANTNKGTAVLELADMLGVPHEHTGAIGDYFNDYEMLKHVAVPAACAQAPKRMHEIAKFHSCHCNRGAVADFLEYIENNCQ